MTGFAYWATQMPDGFFMCCCCFAATPNADAVIDPNDGLRCDVCPDCESEVFGD